MNIDKITPTQQKAWNMYKELVQALHTHTKLFLIIGQKLKIIREEKLYRYLGEGGYDTFTQFLNNPEIGLRQSTAYLYIRIYEYFVEKLKMMESEILNIPISRLMRMLPVLKKKDDKEAKEIITNLGAMTNYDFDIEVKEKGYEIDRPNLFRNKETGKWIFEFKPEQIDRIINKTTNEVIYPLELEKNK